uniref:Uncharacterized protein n=1 Tax=Trichobilharzia regenti TaxID=157069 RepID=A0AA85K1H8_TRIRE|nr:unnamed protein product [Trichobilharzia regenti]
MFQGNGLKASVVNQKASSNQKFRSNTLKCYTDNSSNITTGLIYPSLPRVNMCKTSSDNQELGTFQRKPFSLTSWKDAYSTKE